MEPIIKIENLNLWYEKGKPIEVHALKDINITINKSDYVAFFGPTCCGKTTILYAISGIDRFQDGKVYINERDISGLTNQELSIFRQTGIGIVFQQFNLVPSLNVVKNVALPMLFVGVSSEKAENEALKIINRLGLSEYAYRYPHELSGGQQQRVGIARALANNPPIIIADEPLGNLDSVNAKIVLEFLKELNEKDGRTIIMVTHEAWSLRDVKTIFHMKDGKILDEERTATSSMAASLSKHVYDQLSSVSTFMEGAEGGERFPVRIIANFLLRGYSMDETKRFELLVNDRFDEKIDRAEFYKLINKSFKDGGVGLRKKKTDIVVSYIEEIIEKKKEISNIIRMYNTNKDFPILETVSGVRKWLMEGHRGELNKDQEEALDQVISDRIKNYIGADKVAEILDLSSSKFGVGLSFRASQMMADKLELLLNSDINTGNNL